MGTLGRFAVNAVQWVDAKRARLAVRSIVVQGRAVKYYAGGSGKPLVLLHGLGDEKSSFVSAARALTREHSVILPDLPGHGEYPFQESDDHTIEGLAAWLVTFLDALGLSTVDIGGNSMGGHVALAFATKYPERVDRLILVNAPGAVMENDHVYTGFGESLQNRADLDKLLARVVHRAPSLPGVVAQHMIEVVNRGMHGVNAMARELRTENSRLDDRLANVKAPTLIVWGIHDAILNRAIATAYLAGLPNAKLVELDAGHSPQIEASRAVGAAINEFLSVSPASASRS